MHGVNPTLTQNHGFGTWLSPPARFALAFLIYMVTGNVVSSYCKSLDVLRALWFSNIAMPNMWSDSYLAPLWSTNALPLNSIQLFL